MGNNVLSPNFWLLRDYKQRVTVKEWRDILLKEQDIVFMNGRPVRLIGKNLGAGVVEVSKEYTQVDVKDGHDE
jgi:hypothetical protein